MQQLFVKQSLADQQQLTLQDETYQHLIKVLHMRVNDHFQIVDANQMTFIAQIMQINSTSFTAQLTEQVSLSTELPVKVSIACALSKKDKIEMIAQKATELGVSELIFFESRYSIMKWKKEQQVKKVARLQQIVTAAAQQSKRLYVPKVKYYNNFADLLNYEADYRLVAYEESAKNGESAQLKQVFRKIQHQQSILCLFGPEGGFHVEEIAQLVQNSYIKCALGPRILRAETAPLYFLSALSYQIELN
ncbi:16S rRNA (uracil(1498)-N(3))-methyltransferase [Bombilactobacillus thymidiniphilus]|uniref:Ribosomal RNA small subunit methyltransferase E n=1 Tax=Bombilactobacillus thymidiniphilus TaxID=2923363 RepID=A0ABY4PCY2_9LACO|nr:16S rRNA (uracil(1498)-N(3))-methyltransferase [Bombilactobacillus thymidiniphilus]UQS83528.1 16S rRNA (uracil(1498)-N(3))-methyltransferase [Bombilactobacillus thymidiniphilus]